METSCVVTGAARGIGRGIAERMIARGHRVVITDIDADGVRRTAEEIGAAAGLAQDVRDPGSHVAVAAEAARHGRLVAWFNNAGVGHDGLLAEQAEEQVRRLVDINLMGVIWGSRAALAAFGPEGGDIVNTGSLSAHGPVPGLAVYAATKAAVVSLTTSLAAETPRNVRVHAVCPDGVATQLVADMDDQGMAKALIHSGGALMSVDEAADAAVAMVGSRRVVRTIPAWRGGLMRFTSLTSSVTSVGFGAFAAQGRRAMRKG